MDYSQIPLKAMEMPEAISGWPLAPGWWVVLVLLLSLIACVIVYIRKKLIDPRRFALAELKKIEQAYQENQNKAELLIACNSLLKRMALRFYPRSHVASLSGEEWIRLLKKMAEIDDQHIFELLVTGPYQRHSVKEEGSVPSDDCAVLITACKHWIKKVKPEKLVKGEVNV
jgi:hypothetical protein